LLGLLPSKLRRLGSSDDYFLLMMIS
jgi:hypothetical protein